MTKGEKFKELSKWDRFLSSMNEVDFKHQKQLYYGHRVFLIISAIVSFIYGIIMQKFSYAVILYLISMAAILIYYVPGWPEFRKSSPTWIPIGGAVNTDNKKKRKKQKK
eukprot:TRINITY_DN22838_c0_g1_i1.p1 TRINITY_DN22838_c0_g1~~TRINITY_DN22838_c0_g1_i1.p1  ORF type:complete len:109 (-),score=5.15 TRINITY_DN22838_c0_g1_i1:22-348(-)